MATRSSFTALNSHHQCVHDSPELQHWFVPDLWQREVDVLFQNGHDVSALAAIAKSLYTHCHRFRDEMPLTWTLLLDFRHDLAIYPEHGQLSAIVERIVG